MNINYILLLFNTFTFILQLLRHVIFFYNYLLASISPFNYLTNIQLYKSVNLILSLFNNSNSSFNNIEASISSSNF